VEAPRPAPPAPKRVVPSGPPASRLAGVLRPGPGVEMPIPLEFPSARYPSAARGRGLKVDVHLDILVDEQGKVMEALVREGDTADLGFNEAAVNAALATPFQPATRWDLPGKAWTELIIEFEEGAPSP
jgi:TonB family protein